MPDYLDATEIWYRMKHHCQLHQQDSTVGRKLERFMATFVISPSKQETANFTMDDWANLADEGLEALDSVGLLPKGMKEKVKDIFLNEAQIPEGNNMAVTENISHVAMLLSTVSSKFRPYHFFIAVKPPAFFASSRASSTSTTILRPTCVMAASITPLFLMRFAVGMLHLKTFAKPSIPYS